MSQGDLLATTLPALFRAGEGETGLERALEELCRRASLAVKSGYTLLILSDRGVDEEYAPIPSLLALAAVHNHARARGDTNPGCADHRIRRAARGHALCAADRLRRQRGQSVPRDRDAGRSGAARRFCRRDYADEAVKNFIKAIDKGLLKTFSKMGISTLQSYRGAQVFEAIGLNKDLVEVFHGYVSRIDGVGLDVIAREAQMRPRPRIPAVTDSETELAAGGDYHYRVGGEYHLLNPLTISKLQHAVRQGSPQTFQEYTDLIDKQNRELCTLRGLMEIKKSDEAGANRRGRTREGDRETLRDRSNVIRFHQQGSARDARHRDESHRRQVEHR